MFYILIKTPDGKIPKMSRDLSYGEAENRNRSTHCGETYTIKKYSTDGRPN